MSREYLVEYHGDIKSKVDSYNRMKSADKNGGYWNNLDDKGLKKVKSYIKNHYLEVQNYTCPYCQQSIVVKHNGAWDIEHIIPKKQYPNFMFSPLNLCVSCKDCNQEKLNKDVLKNKKRKTLPKKSEDYSIVHPHLDDYSKHIKVLRSSLFFMPYDEKGRRTIETCGLMRFVYKFTDYGRTSIEVKKKIGEFHKDLLEAESSAEEHMILSLIGEVIESGKEIARKEALNNRRQKVNLAD